MELRFHDRYNLRDGDYFQDYNYLKEAEATLIAAEEWTTASVEGLSCSEGCTWIVMDTSGNTTTTTSTDDEATLDFKFSASGQGKVYLTYELDSTTYSVRHAKENATKMRDLKHCCCAASTPYALLFYSGSHHVCNVHMPRSFNALVDAVSIIMISWRRRWRRGSCGARCGRCLRTTARPSSTPSG